MLHGLPRADNYGCNVCAFCHYWEGDAQLHSHGSYQVEFNERTKGRCLSIGVSKAANYSACSKFQMSNVASRYVTIKASVDILVVQSVHPDLRIRMDAAIIAGQANREGGDRNTGKLRV